MLERTVDALLDQLAVALKLSAYRCNPSCVREDFHLIFQLLDLFLGFRFNTVAFTIRCSNNWTLSSVVIVIHPCA
jgi:hypothetical protein